MEEREVQGNKNKVSAVKAISNQNLKEKAKEITQVESQGEYCHLPVDKLLPFKGQARRHFDEDSIKALASTIVEHGIRQPLTVLPSAEKSGYYEVVSGERRLKAAKLLNLKQVPCIIITDQKKAEEIAIIENVQRKDLHPIELMQAYQNLMDHKICNTLQEIADKIGVHKSSVVDVLNLRLLPVSIREMLIEHKIKNRDFLRELCKAKPADCLEMIDRYLQMKADRKSPKKLYQEVRRQSNIVAIMLEGEQLYITKNKVYQLSDEQKVKLKELLSSLLQLTFDA